MSNRQYNTGTFSDIENLYLYKLTEIVKKTAACGFIEKRWGEDRKYIGEKGVRSTRYGNRNKGVYHIFT